jgi:hypothetical protein
VGPTKDCASWLYNVRRVNREHRPDKGRNHPSAKKHRVADKAKNESEESKGTKLCALALKNAE